MNLTICKRIVQAAAAQLTSTSVAIGVLLGACTTVHGYAGIADVFELVFEQPVSNGVPGRGAGNIEVPGATDTYTFALTETTALYFDEQAGSCSIDWQCDGPNGTVFPLQIICLADPGTLVLEPGAYTMTVSGGGGAVGVYGFTVWVLNAPDEFTIGLKQPVSNGVPQRGAGNIEEAGSIDHYTFTLAAATSVFFDEIGGACNLRWRCDGPGGTVFPAEVICVGDPETFFLEAGDYTITVQGDQSAVGTYGFTLWEVNLTQTFAIGLKQAVSNGVPAAGAGFIEEPGSRDQYTFTLTEPRAVYFDELSGACNIVWQCDGPAGAVFESGVICVGDPETVALVPGDYTITVEGVGSAVGPYSFILWEVNPTQTFAIELDQPVSAGVPARGAGSIEEPGAVDVYVLELEVPTTVFFDETGGRCNVQWSCVGPAGLVFAPQAICVTDPGAVTLLDVGTYTITVDGQGSATGSYAFNLVQVSAPQIFDIELGDTVALDAPSEGAGHIEEPGAIDVYRLPVQAGQEICFDELDGPCNIAWNVSPPGGTAGFANETICVGDPASVVMPADGICTITVYGQQSAVGAYAFTTSLRAVADLDGDCNVNAADLAMLLGAWGPCRACAADLDGSGSVDAADLAVLLGSWE